MSIVIKVRLRNKEKQRSLKAKKQITSNIKEAGSLESVFSLLVNWVDAFRRLKKVLALHSNEGTKIANHLNQSSYGNWTPF